MVTTENYFHNRYSTANLIFDGVVHISADGYVGTGTLLYDGQAVLTAAHLIDSALDARVSFLIGDVSTSIKASTVLLHPDAAPDAGNNDLAILWLDEPAPHYAPRYQIYRDSDEVGQIFSAVGFGAYGLGTTGATLMPQNLQRLQASNRFDMTGEALKTKTFVSWSPVSGSQLIADFDDGSPAHDALGMLAGVDDLGIGSQEGLIASGDSGGPGFIGASLAGVATYTARIANFNGDPDIDASINSSFGEVGAWQRVSYYQEWIDKTVRSRYPDAPSSTADIETQIIELDDGTSYAYFMVTYTGLRESAPALLSVDYSTRDGSATAGVDYLHVEGRLNIYSDETYALIPVEILGDTQPEPDETFYLDIFNPVGAGFSHNQISLSAVRTILDDDFLIT